MSLRFVETEYAHNPSFHSLVFSRDHCPSRVVADRETHGNRVREPREVNTACFGAHPERATPSGRI